MDRPGLGYTVPEAATATARSTDPPWVFRGEVLCQKTDTADGVVHVDGATLAMPEPKRARIRVLNAS